jgi:uncharacterized membrane protein
MLELFYDLLARIGYTDPLHPPFAHMPIGMVVAALVFGFLALLSRRPVLWVSAHHGLVLGLVFWFPTVLAGYLDWQRYYAGAWLFPIEAKLVLAATLLVLLIIGIVLARRQPPRSIGLIGVYGLAFANVVALGYFGGHLVFGGNAPPAPKQYQAGREVFRVCSGCHAHGGNIIAPNLPLRNAPQLEKFSDFLEFLRDPKLPSGATGPMPPFSTHRISEQQARELYDYIVNVIVKPKRDNTDSDGESRAHR